MLCECRVFVCPEEYSRISRYHGRTKGTTKAQPARARLLYDRGFTVGEIMQALQISRRTVYRYLAAEEKA
jgi:DNA invertase Pin-like site-specific DNA recombinase